MYAKAVLQDVGFATYNVHGSMMGINQYEQGIKDA